MATGGGRQIEVSKTNLKVYEDDGTEIEEEEEISDEETINTRGVLYDFVFTRATADKSLTTEQKESFNEAHAKSEDGCGMWFVRNLPAHSIILLLLTYNTVHNYIK